MSDTCHQAGRARCGSKKKKRLKNRPVITESKRPTPVPTAEPDPKMTVSQAPEQKKKKRRNRKRRLLSSTEGPESSDLCSDVVKKPRLSSDSAPELTDTSALCGTRNHNFVADSAAGTNSEDTPSTVIEHYADTAVARVNSTVSASGPVEDDEENERRRIKAHLHKQRKALPIFPVRKELVRVVRQRDCVILIGETACGKTTQLPQYLHATGFTKRGIIGITQPRRVAAVTVADRVAMEMGVELGGLVGYSVRFDDTTSNATRIKYLTDGMLLREALLDPLLQSNSDQTLFLCKLFLICLSSQIVVMSATMDVDHFSHYFNNAPVYTLEGRQHPIEMMYAVKPQEDYVFSALVTVFQIHRNQGPGDILVFCTGQEEIESVVRAARETRLQLDPAEQNLLALPLYAALPSSLQLKVFQPAAKGWRKVIFSTNIAETSITIPGIKYVVDTGVVKERCSLSGVVLQMLALGIEDIFSFDFMDKPSEKHLTEALVKLQQLGAVEKKEDVKLTALGKKMAAFPLEPRFAKIILCSKELGCTDEILTIISILSGDSVLYFNEKQRERAAEVWRKFQSNEGDHVMLLNVYKAYKSVKGNKAWCKENFVNKKNMLKVIEIRSQLADLCVKAGVPSRSCGQDSAAFRKCLASGLFTNVAELQKNGDYLTVSALLHIAHNCLTPQYFPYAGKYVMNLTVVDPDWLPDVAPQYFKKKRLGAKALS
ncbi:hypothetical protein HPB49_006066 [Dermacentor silvarum]|uniref:Uncharacterized protein n=1 Tax=Dermacentor silvarum TaxID=543639 RepID=A0ACB8DBB1_DERSI|nr:hypothetical protein HPB49_006066 [Dermacentor silvarum]